MANQEARERLSRIFRYLKALQDLRYPPVSKVDRHSWHLWLSEIPQHPCVQVTVNFEENAGEGRATQQNVPVLWVKRPSVKECPAPPESVRPWLAPGWYDPDREAQIDERPNPDGEIFNEDPNRVKEFGRWQAERQGWAESERPVRAVMRLYERLYRLHGQMEREGERFDFVLGDGILSWARDGATVYHPLLLQRMHLVFDAEHAEFSLLEADAPTELYTDPLRTFGVAGDRLGQVRQQFNPELHHPLDQNDTGKFLQWIVNQISEHGEFLGSTRPAENSATPRIGRACVLLLRSKAQGFSGAIERVLETVDAQEEVPRSLLRILGLADAPPEPEAEATGREWMQVIPPSDVLFTKPANPEQIRIAQRLAREGAVLVQGPPGTGKTHTIANLIGHLLAQGKSVLVTSHTVKALRVVREQVVQPLRPLCVSVLGHDRESREQLEIAVNTINSRLTEEYHQLQNVASQRQAEREHLINQHEELAGKLRDALSDEYRDIVASGGSFSPAEAARLVRQGVGQLDYIPGPVPLDARLPLPEEEIHALYETNGVVSALDEAELDCPLPDPSSLIPPADFAAICEERIALHEQPQEEQGPFWNRRVSPADVGSLDELATRCTHLAGQLAEAERWQRTVILAGFGGPDQRRAWTGLVSLVGEVHADAAASETLRLENGPALPPGEDAAQFEELAERIRAHVAQGKRLGWFTLLRRPAWKRFLASAKCNARTPSRAEHFAALAAQARLAGKRRRLLDRWNQQMTPLGAPAPEQLGAQPENTARQFKAQIERCLQWHDQQYAPFVAMVSQAGLDFESLLAGEPPWLEEDGELRRIEQCLCGRLRMSLEARRNAARRMQLNETVAGRRQAMEQLLAADHQAPVVVQLRNALRDHDPEAYRHAFQRLTELHRRLEALHRRRSLLARLRPFAPGWAQAIQERTGLYGHNHPPARIAEAWLWRQIKDELDRRSSVSIPDLQERLHAVKNKLEKVTQSLIENKAWAAQIQRSRRNPNLQAALTGWLQTMRAIGAGHGIRVPRLRAEAERLMMTCREAVPVWIMPLSRVVENFNPAVTRFDVVIIDEASQCDVMALLALYMGKEVIVVGDHEQVSPAAVGQELDPVDQLINEHLRPSIPNAHLYDPKRSIYDLAQMFFGETIRLLEHFRCVPQIIQFSNHLSYQGEIKPLREPGKDGLRPFVVARRVNDRYEQSRKINEVEAREIVSLILACSEQPAYSGKTFGVVSLVGEQQAYWIDSLLRRHMEAEKFEKVHRILCGNAAQFQGDERDVVFLSVVDSSDGGVLPLRQTDEFKRRFNVAASRARDQMWVIHSLDPGAHLQPGDLRRRLIEYAENPDALEAAINQAGAAAESPFEKDVAGRLIQAGYRIVPQWRAGSYRIDIVVQGLSDRLAIECDGDRFHPIERIPDDLARQAVLERLGWKFERIRGSEFYRDPDSAMQRVFRRLAELNIEPLGHAADADDNPEPELYQRVLRRAQEIRRELFEAPDEAGTEEEFFFQPIGQ